MHTRHNQAQEVHQVVVEVVGSRLQCILLLQVLQLEPSLGMAVVRILAAVGTGWIGDSSLAEHTEHMDQAVECTEDCKCPHMDRAVLRRLQTC